MQRITITDTHFRAILAQAALLICSRNRPKLLRETVQSVLQGNEVPAELIIVDQSNAPDAEIATLRTDRPCTIQYLWTDSVGLSRARNKGIAAAQHDIIAIIDDDMCVAADWFGNFIRALQHAGERTVVTGRVLPARAEQSGGFVPALVTSEVPAVYHGRIGTDVLAGGHMACYRSAFDEVGGFDERLGAGGAFPAADDNDLGFRLLEAGYQIRYVPEAVVYHRAWRPRYDYLSMRWAYGRGKGGYYTKYLNLHDRYIMKRMLRDITRRMLAFPRRLRSDPRGAVGDVVYIFGIVAGSIKWLLTQPKTD